MIDANEYVSNEYKPSKPFYKKWWFWLIVIIVLSLVLKACDDASEKAQQSASQETTSKTAISSNESDESTDKSSNDSAKKSARPTGEVWDSNTRMKAFMTEYNKISDSPFTDVHTAGRSNYCSASSYGFSIRIENPAVYGEETDRVVVTIYTKEGNEFSEMEDIYYDVSEALDNSLSDEEIAERFASERGFNYSTDKSHGYITLAGTYDSERLSKYLF